MGQELTRPRTNTSTDLVHKVKDILDRETPYEDNEVQVVENKDSKIEDGDLPECDNKNYTKTKAEVDAFMKYKKKEYLPTIDRSKATVLYGRDTRGKVQEILVGPVLKRGLNLPGGRNLADYIDLDNYMFDTTKFFLDHKGRFPDLWILVQCEAALRNVEVGRERFFSLSGYIFAPRRSRLGVRTYERLALLASILSKVYIDKDWVAKKYMRRCKAGAWKKENALEALKCWNLERVLDAELRRAPTPPALSLEELLGEGEGLENVSPSGSKL